MLRHHFANDERSRPNLGPDEPQARTVAHVNVPNFYDGDRLVGRKLVNLGSGGSHRIIRWAAHKRLSRVNTIGENAFRSNFFLHMQVVLRVC